MSGRRLDMHRLQELVRLHRLGRSARKISRLMQMSRKTISRYIEALEEAGLLAGNPEDLPEVSELKEAIRKLLPDRTPRHKTSSVARWRKEIERLLIDKKAGPTAIFDYLRLRDPDFRGSLSAVKRACVQIIKARGIRAEDVAIPVETGPGEVAQVDFGYVGKLYDPERGMPRKAWLFVMTLGYSRHMVARIVFDQKAETWVRLHVECLEELGGVVHTIVPDNLKAAVVRAAFGAGDEPLIHRSYRELARHYGFQIDPTPPRSPEKKGKVERSVQYIKRSFFRPRDFEDVHQARRELAHWLVEIAGQRTHGTTGQKPAEVFEQDEKSYLQPLPARRFELVIWKCAKVHRDSHVILGRKLYSVPWQLIGKEVELRVTESSVSIYHEDEHVWTHDRIVRGRRRTVESHLPEVRGKWRHRSREYWETQASAIGVPVLKLVRAVFDSDEVLSKLRTVQAIVSHLQQFPEERACAASMRALHFGALSYVAVRDILRKGLDLEPLPDARQAVFQWKTRPRFSRVPNPQQRS